jgi:hypothetical protein
LPTYASDSIILARVTQARAAKSTMQNILAQERLQPHKIIGPIMTTTITDLDDFKALDPFFRIIEKGLDGIADGGHFFDLLAEKVIFEYIILTITDRKVTHWRDYLDPVAVFDALGWPSR